MSKSRRVRSIVAVVPERESNGNRRDGHTIMRIRHLAFSTFIVLTCSAGAFADPPTPEQIRAAATKGLTRLQKTATKYTEKRQCFSCHHQAMPMFAFAAAKTRGFDIAPR